MAKKMNGKKSKIVGKTTRIRLKRRFSPAKLQSTLLRYDAIPVLSQRDIRRLLNLTPKQTHRAIRLAMDEEVLIRIKAGLYYLAVRPPSAFVVANYLSYPSYVSLESALSYYRIIPENVYTVTSITPKYPKKYTRLNREFVYHKINKNLFFGYRKFLVGNASVLMAEKEKAVLDYLYFIVQGSKDMNQRSDFSRLDKQKFMTYAELFRKVLNGRKLVAFNRLLESLKMI